MNAPRHDLKTWPSFFDQVLSGEKTFELRRDDRGFQIGDELVLREWLPQLERYTGRAILVEITHLIRGPKSFGADPVAHPALAEGYVVLSFTRPSIFDDAAHREAMLAARRMPHAGRLDPVLVEQLRLACALESLADKWAMGVGEEGREDVDAGLQAAAQDLRYFVRSGLEGEGPTTLLRLVIALQRAHGVALSHEDTQGGFELRPWTADLEEWLAAARVIR